jgi:hypothetical protein
MTQQIFSRSEVCKILKLSTNKLFRIEFSNSILPLYTRKHHTSYFDFDKLVLVNLFIQTNKVVGFTNVVEIFKTLKNLEVDKNPTEKFVIFEDRSVWLKDIPNRLDELMNLEILAYFTWNELIQTTQTKLIEAGYNLPLTTLERVS